MNTLYTFMYFIMYSILPKNEIFIYNIYWQIHRQTEGVPPHYPHYYKKKVYSAGW
jgi:hypothetical protein